MIKIILRLFFNIASHFPFIGEQIRVIIIQQKISTLESREEYDTARIIRKEALSKISPKYHGPILRSEGEDKLHRLKDYQGALEAFEKAISTLDMSPSFYGASMPDRIYAGASQAAVFVGDNEKAKIYYEKFAEMVSWLSSDPKVRHSLCWQKETLSWLETHINELHKAKQNTIK